LGTWSFRARLGGTIPMSARRRHLLGPMPVLEPGSGFRHGCGCSCRLCLVLFEPGHTGMGLRIWRCTRPAPCSRGLCNPPDTHPLI